MYNTNKDAVKYGKDILTLGETSNRLLSHELWGNTQRKERDKGKQNNTASENYSTLDDMQL